MSNVRDLAWLQTQLDASPMIAFARIQAIDLADDPSRVVLRMALRDELRRAPNIDQFHGGAVATLIDTAADFAIALIAGGGVPTVNFRTDFLRPCGGAHIDARATVRKTGRALGVADVDVVDADQRLCAIGRGTYVMAVG